MHYVFAIDGSDYMLMNVFNMGFGESILLQKDRESLLVDCGSKRKDNVESQIEWIWSCMNDPKSISFMLTHFHEDHFNRFEVLVHLFFEISNWTILIIIIF